jgi:chaperonin GroEL
MTNKIILPFDKVEQDILDAVSMIADPVVQTLSPKGGNVMFNDGTATVVSNDGISIAKAIKVEDNFKNSIINLIRESSMRTNQEAGDGTTTSILLTSVLIREGMKLRRDGHNPMEIIKVFRSVVDKITDRLKAQAKVAEDDKDIYNVARISANNDDVIAENVLRTVKTAGLDGMVFIEPNNKPEDEIVEDVGFVIKSGMFRPELRNGSGFTAHYLNVPVLVTDKRLYYKEEAETILRAVYAGGYKEVVVIARDFLGDALNYFIANHTNGAFKLLLVKDNSVTEENYETLADLAAYLDCPVITEKQGSLVNNLDIKQFGLATKVFSDGLKTVIGRDDNKTNPNLTMRLTMLRDELAKDEKNEAVKSRIASLTSGIVTLKVGASTETELREKVFRYEDSVNATRTAMRHGYVVGGGIALLNSYNENDYPDDYKLVFKRFCEASVRQIARNCGKDPDTVLEAVRDLHEDVGVSTIGYNASDGEYIELDKAGVVDPYQVVKLAVENAVSAASNILSVNYYVINEQPKEDK